MTAPALLSSAFSSYVARAIAARPELSDCIAVWAEAPITRARIDARLHELIAEHPDAHAAKEGTPVGEEALRYALRRLRTEVFCAVMERDLAGKADVTEVTSTMTDLAEAAIQRAIEVLSCELEALYGEPRSAGGDRLALGVVGMGKLGGRELNVSSDVDLVFLHPDPQRAEALERPARRLIRRRIELVRFQV